MKKISTLLLFILGFASITLAQETESSKRSLEQIKDVKIRLPKSLELLDLDIGDTIRHEPPIIFTPENPFRDKDVIIFPPSQDPVYLNGIYELPDPQSRMPIVAFPDKHRYTILIKEYK
uniref:hypothetical protein n=1 Tax=Algoriphagus sp. TaxID=1872435 RepID=UPI00258B136B|nr:hypothetical protein [Algoriphagus sp.]